jgi:hypothetical protein
LRFRSLSLGRPHHEPTRNPQELIGLPGAVGSEHARSIRG